VRRQEFATADLARACEVLGRAYGTNLRGLEGASGAAMRHVRYDAGAFSINEITLPGRLTYHCDPTDTLFAAEVMSGTLRLTCGGRDARLMAGRPFLGAPRSGGYVFHTSDVRIRQLTMNGRLVGRVAEGRGGRVRFVGFQPPSQALCRLWRETVSFATQVVKSPTAQQPLVLDMAARTVAAAVMTCFPNTVSRESNRSDEPDASSMQLRKAIAFIEANVDREIGIVDIAGAIYVTPRSVQLMFRRHLGTTPTAYVRRLRLQHVHRDLVHGDAATVSVAQVAGRWGFAHGGRFAAMYRQAYGCAPHATLRGR
jgi:AraC-like DNA-binding protein